MTSRPHRARLLALSFLRNTECKAVPITAAVFMRALNPQPIAHGGRHMHPGTSLSIRTSTVTEMRRAHQEALARPMTGAPMMLDPRFDDSGERVDVRRACQYATEVARRSGILTGDLSGLDAVYVAPDTVVFVRADISQAEVARVTVPRIVRGVSLERAQLDPGACAEVLAAVSLAERIIMALSRYRPRPPSGVSAHVASALQESGISFERKIGLPNPDRPHGQPMELEFLVGDVALAIYAKGQPGGATKLKCGHLLTHPKILALIVVTDAPERYPVQIAGKPTYTFGLGGGWL